MTLGQKIVALFLVLGLSLSIGSYTALNLAVFPAFSEFERESSESAVARVAQVLEANLRTLEIFNLEYALWDHTYAYVNGRRPEYADENLDPAYWHSVDVDMMLIFDVRGNLLYSHIGDPTDGSSLVLEEEVEQPLASGHPLVTHENTSDFVKGILQTRSGLMQVVSFPILTSEEKGPIAGSLVAGQFLDNERVIELGKRATAEVSIYPATMEGSPPRAAAAIQKFLSSDETQHSESNDTSMLDYSLVRDVLGTPAAVLEVSTPRRISRIGADTVRTAMIFLGATSTIFLLAAWLFMQRLIVAPVKRLTQQMLGIRQTGDLRVEMGADRSDEVGALAGEFGQLTSRLSQAQQELEEARDEALAMSKTKSEFLARMSHEIRTPMNGVLGMTELLQGTQLDNRQEHFTQTIYESAVSLLEIINDILDFSKIEAGKLELDLFDVDLHDLLDETIDSLANQAHGKGLELINMPPLDLHSTVQVDPGRLRQVLTNLVGNAIKFTEKGEVILRVTATEDEATNLEVHFEIEDTGIGINPDKHEGIFDSFAQEDGSTTRLYGGTGLGLAISKQIVELMGGTLAVASTPGIGSVFSFTVPMKRGATSKLAAPTQSRYVAGNRVLIVDDNATNLEILEHQLSSWRAHTDSAESASEALAVLESAVASGEPHDLAILDMHMPHTDGLGLARAIRDNPDLMRLKLIMLSSVATPVSEDVLQDLNIAGQLTKPIRQSQLYDSLTVALGGDQISRGYPKPKGASVKALSGRVLLAEDNIVNQAVAVGMLEAMGLSVIVAINGGEALEKATEEIFNVILMDCQMPGMDGFQATEEIRRVEAASGTSSVPIIAVTANALKGDRERCLLAGMTDYLTKPFTAEQLHSVLLPFLRSVETPQTADLESHSAKSGPVHAPAENDPPIDRNALDVLSRLQQSGTPNILQKVINIYLESSAELKSRLRVAMDTANATLMRESAHALRSSSANVGANVLADLCRRLEIMGRENDLSEALTIHELFEREYERVVAALRLEAGPAKT